MITEFPYLKPVQHNLVDLYHETHFSLSTINVIQNLWPTTTKNFTYLLNYQYKEYILTSLSPHCLLHSMERLP